MEKKLRLHFIGIGGSSMNGLALIMKNRGHIVSGSDIAKSPFTDYLESQGITVIIGQKKENIKDFDLVIHTAAISDANEELAEARARGITTVDRATFLGKITKEFSKSVGIAGCHGKTTVTSMVGLICLKVGLDPTIHIGGIVPFFKGGGTHIGTKDIFITEACEYENSYLQFDLDIAIINNIDNDHLNFFGSIENIVQSFLTFAKQLPKSGLLIANMGDKRVKTVASKVDCNVQGYAVNGDAEWTAKNINYKATGGSTFTVARNGKDICDCNLNVPGEHNILNALASMVLCYNLGVPVEDSCKALTDYKLTKRRFEYYGKVGNSTLIHDYAHHPTEIAACIKTAEPLPHRRLRGIFQCHTFSRALNHLNDFGKVLSSLDEVVITDIYPAREIDEGKISGKDIADAVNKNGGNAIYIPTFEEVKEYYEGKTDEEDIILAMGAGDIGEKVKILLNR